VNLIGEHVDYVGGLVLPAAVDRFVALAVAPGDKWDVRSGTPGGERFLAALAAEIGAPPHRVAIASDLDAGFGMSSSAALLVAAAKALQPELDGREAALLCQRAEQRATGVMVGVMDQFASALGREGFAILLNCDSLESRYLPFPADVVIAVIDTGVRRELSQTPYNQRRSEAEAAVAESPIPLLELDDGGDNPRLRHVVSELKRVREFAVALEIGDHRRLGELINQSHASLRDDFQVSTPEVDAIVARAQAAPGCIGARIMGAGFGGSVLALLEAGAEDGFAERIGAPVQVCRTATGAFA
jgi:galactokinase